ncbi:MAG: roadblock/LC7 domain-containing protein [Candidatus Thorarchaeota archaeon]
MSKKKIDKLQDILMKTIADADDTILGCVVTNERGLIVSEVILDGQSNETLAAMVSLVSDSTQRVSKNLGYGNPRTSLIRPPGVTIAVSEFLVMNRRFRMGTILEHSKSRRSLFRRRQQTLEGIEDMQNKAIREIRSTLEDRRIRSHSRE